MTKMFRFPLQLFHLNRLSLDWAKVIHYLAMVIRFPAKVPASHSLSAR